MVSKIPLKNQSAREMWYYDLKGNFYYPIWIVAESDSGDTVELWNGTRLRTATKNHVIFNSYNWVVELKRQRTEDIVTE